MNIATMRDVVGLLANWPQGQTAKRKKMNKHASNVQTMPRSPSLPASVATQLLALVLVFFAVGTAAYVQLVNIGVIYSW
jgi:hypothetical protein